MATKVLNSSEPKSAAEKKAAAPLKFAGSKEIADAESDNSAHDFPSNGNTPLDSAVSEMPEELRNLRLLLLEPEQKQIFELERRAAALQKKVEDLQHNETKIVSRALPEAISQHSAAAGDELPEAFLPILENSLKLSVERHPALVADTMFPIFAPAIARAVADAIQKMIHSFNETLDQSLSPRSVRWRVEALQTGKSFAEVVLLHTLEFRVEQVFLIHAETGLLLEYQSASDEVANDADMISGMLTAIQDFVRDSFTQENVESQLDHLRVGDLQVWIERSDFASLAMVIRGNAPLQLREVFARNLQLINSENRRALKNFDGDTSVLLNVKERLADCLLSKVREREIEKNWRGFTPFRIFSAIIVLGFLWWAVLWALDYTRWSNYLERLRNEPGIIIIESGRGWMRHKIAGLRDPLALDPNALLSEYRLKPEKIEARWTPFYALDPDFVARRATTVLSPPETVTLKYDEGVLQASGTASQTWVNETQKLALFVPGVRSFDASRVSDGGEAELTALKNEIETFTFLYGEGTVDFVPNQNEALEKIIGQIEQVTDIAAKETKSLRIQIEGHASDSGNENGNARTSLSRAKDLLIRLTEKSKKIKDLQTAQNGNVTAIGFGTKEAAKFSAREQQLNCRAVVRISWR